MTAPNKLNLWMAEDIVERDALSTVTGLQLGDMCLVDGTNIYVCVAIVATLGTWLPLGGVPTTGRYGLGARNLAPAAARVFGRTACTFRALLDGTPSSIALTPDSSSNWTTTPTPVIVDEFGFDVHGESDPVPPGGDAWNTGTYLITY